MNSRECSVTSQCHYIDLYLNSYRLLWYFFVFVTAGIPILISKVSKSCHVITIFYGTELFTTTEDLNGKTVWANGESSVCRKLRVRFPRILISELTAESLFAQTLFVREVLSLVAPLKLEHKYSGNGSFSICSTWALLYVYFLR